MSELPNPPENTQWEVELSDDELIVRLVTYTKSAAGLDWKNVLGSASTNMVSMGRDYSHMADAQAIRLAEQVMRRQETAASLSTALGLPVLTKGF